MTTVAVRLNSTSANSRLVSSVSTHATEASPMAAPISHTIPPAIDRGQAYYWSHTWQIGEQESRAEFR